MAENFPNLKKETDIQTQKTQRIPNKINRNRFSPRHIIIKMAKVKERILKAAREKQRVNYRGTPRKAISCFLYKNDAGQKGVARYIQSPESEKPET